MEAGEGCACVERDPQPFGDARGGRRFEPWERTISLLQCKEKSNQVCKVRRFGIPANMAGFSSIPRAHMTPSTPVAARTCAASARERTSPLAKTGIRTAWEIDGAGGDSWKSLLFRKAVTHWHNRQRKTQEYKGRREWWTELSSWNVPNPSKWPSGKNLRHRERWIFCIGFSRNPEPFNQFSIRLAVFSAWVFLLVRWADERRQLKRYGSLRVTHTTNKIGNEYRLSIWSCCYLYSMHSHF